MADEAFKTELDLRRKKHNQNFSNYENAVTLVSSLEAWFNFRWGPNGTVRAGLLDYFNRFPFVDDLTPDFEVRFHTPYILWGDHKRTIQPAGRGKEVLEQIMNYAARRPQRPVDNGGIANSVPPAAVPIPYDVVVIVNSENDNIAAEAINIARRALIDPPTVAEEAVPWVAPWIAPIIVLGSYLDRESINNEWFKIKWRDHHRNNRFSTPNVSADECVDDLNKLFVEASHHAIPVNKSALNLSGRSPFMNDTPPPFYTAIRLVIPAINSLLSDDERDQLQASGRVEKTLTKTDVMGTNLVTSMKPQPKGLGQWVDAALDFMKADLNCARVVPDSDPKQYIVTIENSLLKSDPKELWAERAANRAARKAARVKRKRTTGSDPNQMPLFE